ncbi:hypothetical protein Tco_1192862, partial [Tanacetum coccineum]
IDELEKVLNQQTRDFENAKIELFKKNQFDSFSSTNVNCESEKESEEKKNLFESETCIVELEKTLVKQTKENSNLLMKIDNLENAFADEVTHLKKTSAQKSKDLDDVKLELSNRIAKFETYFEKLENTKVILEQQLARKVDDYKDEMDQFLKEINHLRTQLEKLKGKSVKTKFDKPLILGKPPADKLLITSQLSKS